MKLVRKELMKRPAGQITYAMKSNAGIPKGGLHSVNTISPKSTLLVPRKGTYRLRANTNDEAVIKELSSYKPLFDDLDKLHGTM